MNNCKEEFKEFYKFVHSKIKKGSVLRLKIGDDIYEESRDMSEIRNTSFQLVCIEEIFLELEAEVRSIQKE